MRAVEATPASARSGGDRRRHRLDGDAPHLLLEPAGAVLPGTTGVAVPGYELRLVDEDAAVLPGPGTGGLEVRGDSCAADCKVQRFRLRELAAR